MERQIKKKRKAINLSQKEAAEKIGVAKSTVSMWECGKSIPESNRLKKIAQVYNCSIEELLD